MNVQFERASGADDLDTHNVHVRMTLWELHEGKGDFVQSSNLWLYIFKKTYKNEIFPGALIKLYIKFKENVIEI